MNRRRKLIFLEQSSAALPDGNLAADDSLTQPLYSDDVQTAPIVTKD